MSTNSQDAMRRVMKRLRIYPLALTMVAISTAAQAEDADFPTFFAFADGGYATYKSALVHSNDVASTISYGLGIWAGASRNIGIIITRESSNFSFALNDSAIRITTSDILVRYRLGPVYAGLGMNSAHWLVSRPLDNDGNGKPDEDTPGEPLFDSLGNGYSANLGTEFKLTKSSAIYLDLVYGMTTSVQEKSLADDNAILREQGVTLGPRLGISLGGLVDLTKRGAIAASFGFKMRTYGVGLNNESFSEAHHATTVGVRISLKP